MTSPTALPPPYVLRRWGTEVKRFRYTELEPAVKEFWDEIIGSTWDPESRWYGWELSIEGTILLRSTPELLDRKTLLALGTRRSEPGFSKQLITLQLAQLRERRFEPAAFLALEPHLDRIEPVVAVLRSALGVTAPLVHLGRLGDELPRPTSATFTLATHSGVYPNGAGSITYSTQWRLELHEPSRLGLSIDVTEEEGTEPQWTRTLDVKPGAEEQPLLDAFLERALSVEARTNPHLD